MNVQELIENFVGFMNTNLSELMSKRLLDNDSMNDWLQANWEILVEAQISPTLRLEILGEGADLYGLSSRVSFPDDLPTHRISCKPSSEKVFDVLNNEEIDLNLYHFDNFVSWDGNQYGFKGVIDSVLLLDEDGDIKVSALEDVVFYLSEIS